MFFFCLPDLATQEEISLLFREQALGLLEKLGDGLTLALGHPSSSLGMDLGEPNLLQV